MEVYVSPALSSLGSALAVVVTFAGLGSFALIICYFVWVAVEANKYRA